jgi:vesicle coat complex subunit
MLIRALFLKDTITIFISQNMVADKDSKNLSKCIITREDWAYCSDVITFMKPLFLLIKDLEGKLESSANSFITNVLPAFDFMADHIND